MPKLQVKFNPALTAENLMAIFQKQFQGKYEITKNAMLFGVDFAVKKSGWTGIAVKLIQKKDSTFIRFNPFMPSPLARLLGYGLITIIILYATSWGKLQKEITEFIQNSPDFK